MSEQMCVGVTYIGQWPICRTERRRDLARWARTAERSRVTYLRDPYYDKELP